MQYLKRVKEKQKKETKNKIYSHFSLQSIVSSAEPTPCRIGCWLADWLADGMQVSRRWGGLQQTN